MSSDKPRNLKPDSTFMVEYQGFRFPCTDSNSMAKLNWDRMLVEKQSNTFKLESK